MSRGLGRAERALLEEIGDANGGYVLLSTVGMTRSEAESRKRAARSLEAKGLAASRTITVGGRRRAVAMSPGFAEPHDLRAARADAERSARERRDAQMDEARAVERLRGLERGPEASHGPVRVTVSGSPADATLFADMLRSAMAGGRWSLGDASVGEGRDGTVVSVGAEWV